MYLSKNSRYIIQRTWFAPNRVRHCLNQTCRYYSTKLPQEDSSRPALRLNIPNDPAVDPQYQLYQLKGCIDCEAMKTVEKTASQAKKETSKEHLIEINQMLGKQEEKVITKSVSNEVLVKPTGDSSPIQNSTSKESKSVSKIPVKIYSQNNLGKEKKISESELKLKNKSSKEKAVGKIFQEITKNRYVKTSLSTPEALKKPELFLELRKNNKEKKMGITKIKAKSAENVRKEPSETSLTGEVMEGKDEAVQPLRRTKAQENFNRKTNVIVVGKKEAKSVGDLTKEQTPHKSPIRISHLDNRNISVPVRDEYLAAAIESVIPKTKTVEVKMKFRVRIDRVGQALTNEEIKDGIDTAELAYELVSDDSKPKTPKTRKTEKVVKEVLKTIVDRAKDVLEDRRISKSASNLKEQKVQMVQLRDLPEEKTLKYGKKLTFEVRERDDRNKIVNFRRFPLPKTRLEKSVSYHGRFGENNVQYLSNDRFQFPGEEYELSAVARRSPKIPTRILKPLASQVTMIDEVPEYLKYPEFKYVGLSSTASRNFHQTASQFKYRQDFSEKRAVMVMDSMVKGKEARSPRSSKEMISRAVTSVQKGTSKPIHMSIPVPAETKEKPAKEDQWKHELCPSRPVGSPLRKSRSRIARPYKNYNISKNNSVLALNERLARHNMIASAKETSSPKEDTVVFFKNPETDIGSRYLGSNSGLIDKKTPAEEEKLNKMMPGLLVEGKSVNKEECGGEDITDYTKCDSQKEKNVQKAPCQGDIELKNRAGKDYSKEKPFPQKWKALKEMYSPEFELNQKCINKRIQGQGEKSVKFTRTKIRERFRFNRMPCWAKDNIINVMKPPITPKMSDNLVNVANEPLNATKGAPSVDSLRMMEKVKKMLDLDLKNAEKIFVPEKLEKASSVLQLVGDPWKWKVDAEELEKRGAEKSGKNITSDVSLLCLNHENVWKTMNLPENVESKKIGNENSSAMSVNPASNSYRVDEKFLDEMRKKSEEELKACKGYDCEKKKPEENNVHIESPKSLDLRSVVAFNSDSGQVNFSIVNTELAQCQENTQMNLDKIVYDIHAVESCKNVKGTSAVLCKSDGFEIDQEALKLAKGKQPGDDATTFHTPKNIEVKKDERVPFFDEKVKPPKIFDISKPKSKPVSCKNKEEPGDINKPVISPIPIAKEETIRPPKPKKSPEKVQKFIQNRNIPLRKIPRMQRKPCYMYNYASVEKKSNKHLQFGKRKTETPESPPKTSTIVQQVTTQVQSEEKKMRDDVLEPKTVIPPIKPMESMASTTPPKKEHYVSDNILEMTKNNSHEKVPATKSNIGETVRVDVTSTEHPPSKITEINLNKDSNQIKNIPEKNKTENKVLIKDLEKYQTPYSEPDYEDKPIKINSDIKSNPNIKKLDATKTTVLNDVSKPTENIDGWLRDETDKMTNMLIKVLQEATEAKSKRKLLISSKVIDKNQKRLPPSKSKSSEDVVRSCKVPDLKKKALDSGKSKPKNINEIPVQTSKNIQPPKTVDAVDVNNMSVVNRDFKAASEKVNKEIFDVNTSQELIDPIGINADNLTDFNIKKVTIPTTSALKLNAESLKKFLKIRDIPVKPILPANLEVGRKDVAIAGEESEDFPGPEGLKKLSLIWKYLPAVGCQATVYIFQLAQIGASLFGTYSSSKLHNRTFHKLFSKYGPIVKLPGPLGGEVLLINRPEHIKSFFDQEGQLPVRSVFDSVDRCRILSRSKASPFFNLEDWKANDWEEVRKVLRDSTLKTEKYFDFFQNAGKLLVRRIQSNRDIHSQTSEDFMNEIRRWSLECMCYVVFDKSFGFLNFNTFDWSLEANRLMKLLTDATDCILKCETGFQIWRFVDTPSSIILSNACQSIESVVGKHVRHAEINLAKKKPDLLAGKISAGDLSLVEHMLLIDGLSYDQIVYMILDLFLVGVNTTSSALGFLLYRLAQNTRVQRKLLKEARNVLPDKNSELSYHRLHSLKYLQACLKESLRLNAPMPLLIRNLQHDIFLADSKVSKGTTLVMDTQAACMKEQNFEDPEKFSPERWLDPNHMNFAAVPFCHGPKAEVGKRLAEMQVWSCVAQMVRNFKIEYNYGDIKGTEEVISFPNKPLKLSFVDRED